MNNEFTARNAVAEDFGRQAWADWAGMLASIGCAIHCASLPLLIAYLPALGLEWLAGEGFHQWMAVICIILATTAFVPGWWKHRSFLPATFGAGGVVLLMIAAYGMEDRCCPTVSDEVAVTAPVPACCDASCVNCESDKQIAPVKVKHAGFDGVLTPLITPLGGLLLVIGHISNHRKSCHCRIDHCCLANDDTDSPA